MTDDYGDREPACYPTERATLPPDWHWEIMPLTFGRARIVATDGACIGNFW